MQNYQTLSDALQVANQVLSGKLEPALGCGLIAAIAQKLEYPKSMEHFVLLAHDQIGHEGLGIEVIANEILEECRNLLVANVSAQKN